MLPRCPAARHPRPWRDRFLARYFWLILRNALGWTLILLSLVAGPLVPGPGGIPLFLIGFALVSLPGKRRFLARVLRGRPFQQATRWVVLIMLAAAVLGASVALSWTQPWSRWPLASPAVRALVILVMYLGTTAAVWLGIHLTVRLSNACLRLVPPARRRIRPWLRRHRIRLLPPRRRQRLPHEPGRGPYRLRDEILKLVKAPSRLTR